MIIRVAFGIFFSLSLFHVESLYEGSPRGPILISCTIYCHGIITQSIRVKAISYLARGDDVNDR